jgi:hypothetical protein
MTHLSDLQSYFSDYHKDFYGFRPRPTADLWNDATWLQKQIDYIDSAIERMKETFEGREELRCNNWIIEEADPKLAQQARWLADERQRFMDEEWTRLHQNDPHFDEESA